jgi:BTB/POZ domain
MSLDVGQEYFDVDGDDELRSATTTESETLQRSITWRGDPDETGSDCTIVVVTNELQTNTYYVHKSIICFGSKQSKYFALHLLQNASATKSMNDDNRKKVASVKVELDQRDAENFPTFLDFMYKPNVDETDRSIKKQSNLKPLGKSEAAIIANGTMETVLSSFSSPSLSSAIPSPSGDMDDVESTVSGMDDITTDNAVSIRYLARRFENDALTLVVNKFIQKDLNFNTGPIYLYKAWDYKDDRLLESVQRLCAENIAQIDTKALIRLPPNLFRIVVKSLESFEDENKELSLLLSDVVCRYLEQNPKASSAELLLDLTDPLLMPYISPDAAIGYTAIVKDLVPEDAAVHWDSLVRLCRRCAKAVVKEYGWSDFSVCTAVNEYLTKAIGECHQNKLCSSTSCVDSLLFATSFSAALEQAQDDYDDILTAHDRFNKLIPLFHESVTILEKAGQRKDDYIVKQQNELRSARHEIRDLKRQVNDLKQQRRQMITPPQQQKKQYLQQSNSISHLSLGSHDNKSEISIPLSQSNSSADRPRQLRQRQTHASPSKNRDRDNASSLTRAHPEQQRPSQQQNIDVSLAKSSHDLQQPLQPASTLAPMARQRLQQHQKPQQSNHNLHDDPTCKQRAQQQHLNHPKRVQHSKPSEYIDRTRNQQHIISQQQQNYTNHQQEYQQQPYDESITRLCMGSQRMQQQPASVQQSPPQKQSRRKHHHVSLTNANDDQYRYHPDLLEMSYSEPISTMDDDDDDDDDSLLQLEMSFSTLGQDLISPTQVGANVHNNKNEKRLELKTKNEMRSKSLLV